MTITLPTIPNLRDVGGLATTHGRRVRTGQLFRSVALDAAADGDLRTLAGLGVRTVLDLRTAAELARKPDRLPPGARHIHLDLLVDSGEADPAALFALMADPPHASAELGNGGTERFYLATYRDMIRLPSARAGYARFFRTIADPASRPALVHCTTGKDRTGWAVAALLLFLGADHEAVLGDYLVSDTAVRQAFAPMIDDFVERGGRREVIEPLMSVRPSFLEAALETMQEEFETIDGYLERGLGLDGATLERLRGGFLEAA